MPYSASFSLTLGPSANVLRLKILPCWTCPKHPGSSSLNILPYVRYDSRKHLESGAGASPPAAHTPACQNIKFPLGNFHMPQSIILQIARVSRVLMTFSSSLVLHACCTHVTNEYQATCGVHEHRARKHKRNESHDHQTE